MSEISAIVELLGEKRVEKLKDEIVDILIERLREDLNDYGDYIFYPPDYSGLIETAVKEAEKKIKKIYVDKLVEEGIKKLGVIEK